MVASDPTDTVDTNQGLFVTLEPQASWKALLDRGITGDLDGDHMLAGQPLAATIRFGAKVHIVTPFSRDLNGNGKPVHPNEADALKRVDDGSKAEGRSFSKGMVSPVSTQNYELRCWLASGNIHQPMMIGIGAAFAVCTTVLGSKGLICDLHAMRLVPSSRLRFQGLCKAQFAAPNCHSLRLDQPIGRFPTRGRPC